MMANVWWLSGLRICIYGCYVSGEGRHRLNRGMIALLCVFMAGVTHGLCGWCLRVPGAFLAALKAVSTIYQAKGLQTT